ncbi:hypothetical protein TNCV_2539441 [Trichonephila clavipes]|nr:hypothetical protein TNCV_2539441 [Trichonephila clavipes]
MATGSYTTPIYSRSQSEVQGDLHKVSDRGWHVTSSSPVSTKTHHVGKRCMLNLSRAQASSCWCGVVVRRGGDSSGIILVT